MNDKKHVRGKLEQQELNSKLINACINGDLDLVNNLLEVGADPTVFGNASVISAQNENNVKIVERLLKDERIELGVDRLSLLEYAAKNNNLEILDSLLNKKYEYLYLNGANVVRYAIEKGHIDSVLLGFNRMIESICKSQDIKCIMTREDKLFNTLPEEARNLIAKQRSLTKLSSICMFKGTELPQDVILYGVQLYMGWLCRAQDNKLLEGCIKQTQSTKQ